MREFEAIISALECIHHQGRDQTAKVSPVTHLLRAYDMRAARDRAKHEQENPHPKSVSEEMWMLKCFVKQCEGSLPKASNKPIRKKSTRIESAIDQAKKDKLVEQLLKGKPPHPNKTWTKEALIDSLERLEGTGKSNEFIKKVIELGNSSYNHRSSIFKLFQKWKSTQTVCPVGRPLKMSLEDAEMSVKKVLSDRTSDSSAFVLSNMKEAYASKLKERAANSGLDPDSVGAAVSDNLAKTMTLAAAMGEGVGTFTSKKLLTKTEKRFQSEHSLMMGYSYATTVLATHFIEGAVPRSLSKFRAENLDKDALETTDSMKEALCAKEVYPVNPNLVLSTDDTTLFVFEGANNSTDNWEWKIVDESNGNSSVRSDFKVGDDAEMSGGLRVRLTFTFTASGLAAPPYIAVSGLSETELCPEKCPDGILAAEVPGLCKGGDDVSNKGNGWLVFLRADRKEKQDDDDEAGLTIANKKFIHYNDDVLLPFIRAIREKLGWNKGQPVPECLKSCSWFDGDIGQLQTMLYEAREALDLAGRICRNKHSAAATGTQQPCDLSSVFRTLRQIQKTMTAKDDNACGLAEDIRDLFAFQLRAKGLNLDGNRRKKRALIDFLLCLPEMLEACLKKKHIVQSFVEAGMIDQKTKMVPVFEQLLGTCKRYVSLDTNVGVKKKEKVHCRSQFQHLMQLQLDKGQITYPEMKSVGIPIGKHCVCCDCFSIISLVL